MAKASSAQRTNYIVPDRMTAGWSPQAMRHWWQAYGEDGVPLSLLGQFVVFLCRCLSCQQVQVYSTAQPGALHARTPPWEENKADEALAGPAAMTKEHPCEPLFRRRLSRKQAVPAPMRQ